ncbi:embryonic polarity protein dorsal-like [Oppia nitens]|uniref:embryonic polarity protein dorsal-like n=1 Tax=Oppia nitens TaxID=1686743 RepID=UPI0023DC5624|nr:embryonic polarity protein dorsal-like [Oppia nitens]
MTSPMAASGQQQQQQPYVRIVEQPAKCALRFRYECEGRSAGSIPGSAATADNKTYPSIQVCNYRGGAAVVVVSCVTKEQPYRPHPHNLVGKEGCKKGVCTMVINNQDMICSFTSLGIQCVKRKDIEDSLKLRESIKVDPFRTGFAHKSQSSSIDLNVVRLCFQVFIEGPERDKFTVQLPPIVSDFIYDKKAMTELIITKLSHCSAPCIGGKEMILLCDRVTKDDIQVRFYEEQNGQLVWEALAEFAPTDVHKQVAICFRTPRYCRDDLSQPVSVMLQLRRPSDGCLSDPRAFQLLPKEVDPDGLNRKRQKIDEGFLKRFMTESSYLNVTTGGVGPSNVSPVSPKGEPFSVPRYVSSNIKMEPLGLTAIDSQNVFQTSTLPPLTSWQPSPQSATTTTTTTSSQFMTLSPHSIAQQSRSPMDMLLSQQQQQDYRLQASPQSQTSQDNTTDYLMATDPQSQSTLQPLSSTTLTPLFDISIGNIVQQYGNSLPIDSNMNNRNNANNLNININTLSNNNDTVSDEVMDKFDSLGLEGIDTSELLTDINFNSFTSTYMADMMDSGPNIGPNNQASSSLQTPDLNTGTTDDNSKNLMANPLQMQSLHRRLTTHFDANCDKINNN